MLVQPTDESLGWMRVCVVARFVCTDLPQGVHGVHGHCQIAVAADCAEVLTQHSPDAAPHQPDAPHVEVADLDNLGQAEHAWCRCITQLIQADCDQAAHKRHDGIAV